MREQWYAILQNNTWMLLRCLRSTHCLGQRRSLTFSSVRVFGLLAHHCAFVSQTQAYTLIPCQNKRLQQQRPVSHFVISGNRWTSPKPSGCSCIFLFLTGSWKVRGWFFSAERPDFRSIQPVRLMGEAKDTFVVHYTVCTAISEHYSNSLPK